jgi:threonine synthase
MMRFINTLDFFRNDPDPRKYTLKEALFKGQAPGKGLFVPEYIIRYPDDMLCSLKGRSYADIAFSVLQPYFDEIPKSDFERIIRTVYGNIQAPVQELYPGIFTLELFKNWTFAFKDFAAQLLAAVIEYYLKQERKKIVVFVGTSGDTGPAINEAFLGKENITVYCLFPKGRVTPIQRKQMTTLGQNIVPIEVDGDFYDCQELAKSALDDPVLREYNPTSANSINWGRFIPQAVFSFWMYSQIADYPEEITISIPTGNAGHIGSNFLAWQGASGLPVTKFVAPHNRNNYLVRMLEQGKPEVEVLDTFDCLSNAMNVKLPNNIPRILYLFKNDIKRMQEVIFPVTVDDEETARTIKKVYEEKGYILDVHSAVALAGTFRFLEKNPEFRKRKTGVFLTADPAKFPEKIKKILGFEPQAPEKLKKQLAAPDKEVYPVSADDLVAFRAIIKRTAGLIVSF